jgi:hypothetical protein
MSVDIRPMFHEVLEESPQFKSKLQTAVQMCTLLFLLPPLVALPGVSRGRGLFDTMTITGA